MATAGCNLITANIPARDLQENEHFSANGTSDHRRYHSPPSRLLESASIGFVADVRWWQETYDWVDANLRFLNKTEAIPGYGSPSIAALDGTTAMDQDEGYLFLFNAGPLPRTAILHVDEMIGLSNASKGWSWLVRELYPSPTPTPIAVWNHGDTVSLTVGGTQVLVLEVKRLQTSTLTNGVLAMNLSHTGASVSGGVLRLANVTSLAGTEVQTLFAARVKPSSVEIDGTKIPVSAPFAACKDTGLEDWFCASTQLRFEGTAITWMQQATDTLPPPDFAGGWFNSTFTISSAILAQLERSQAEYPINWEESDMDATWLAPNRLLLYPYIVHPLAGMKPIEAWVDGKPLPMLPAYNSRGNHESKGCFLGFYANLTGAGIAVDTPHSLALHVDLSALPKPAGSFLGVFFQNTVNEYSSLLAL